MAHTQEPPLKLALIAGVGMFLSTLDSGIINVAIPGLIKAFSTDISTVIWTVTLYTLILSSTIIFWGHLADKKGRLKIYTIGLILFAISSLLCGASLNIEQLIIFRGLQGLSAAMMQATAIAMITTRLQGNDAAKAMGIMGMLLGLGPTLGPVVGGLILSSIGWRWIFWINIPICLIGLYGCKQLTKTGEVLHSSRINYVNLILLSVSLFSILILLNKMSNNLNYQWILIITAILLLIYFITEYRSKNRLIPLSYFKQLKFAAPILGIFAFGGASSVAFILPPLYFEKIKLFSAWQVGLLCLAAPVGLVISARVVAKFVHQIGTLKLMMIGISIMSLALLMLTQMNASWPNYIILALLLCYGLGGGMFQTPCYINITSQFSRERQAFITALTRMLQNLSVALESAGVALLISLQTFTQNTSKNLLVGIQHGWWLAGLISLTAAAVLFFNVKTRQK